MVINNIEPDHLDFYKNGLDDLVKTFNIAVSQAKKVIINNDNNGTNLLTGKFVTFGLKDADYVAKNIEYSKEGTTFDIYFKDTFLINIFTPLGGVHNVYNNLAVFSALNEAGVDLKNIKDSFGTFAGMGRRFQKVCEVNGFEVYDDYAHHPTEIKATLDAAAKKFGKEHIVAVFQPHRYTRLKNLWNDFKCAFENAKRVIVTDVYAASEDIIEGISGENFAAELPYAEYISGSIEEVGTELYKTLKAGDIVIGLGAGTITNLGKAIKKSSEEVFCK